MNPDVSIIMPAFNASETISDAITSVVSQDFPDWELLVVDDASEDDTRAIVESFRAKESRIRLIENPVNRGRIESRNLAIELAQGRYIAFLDSDDFWLPTKLSRQVALMESERAVLSYTAYRKFRDDDGASSRVVNVPLALSYEELLRENVIACSSAIYDAGVLGKRYMNPRASREDFMLWLDILSDGERAVGLDDPLLMLRKRRGSQSSDKMKAVRETFADYRDIVGLRGWKLAWIFGNYFLRSLLRHVRW